MESLVRRGNKLVVTVIIGLIVLVSAVTWALFERKQAAAPSNPAMVQESEKNDITLRGADSDIEFTLNPDETRIRLAEISDGTVVSRPVDKDMQYVTVFVQAKNRGNEAKSLRAPDQVLLTAGGKRVAVDPGLQKFISNGNWYEKVPAGGFASGTLVFQIPANDRVDSIELHGGPNSDGVVLKLNSL